MDTSIKSIITEMNRPLVDKIIDASDQVSTDFKHNETIIDNISPDVTKEKIETLKKFISDLYNQAVEKGRVNLEEKRVIRDMWGKKYILSKWYNKWYYRIMFKRAVNNYMMCAGEQYYIEHEFYNIFKPLENIEEILCNKIEFTEQKLIDAEYNRGFEDAIEKAKQIIINFMPLPSSRNHNINLDKDALEERYKYAIQIATRFEEKMNEKRNVKGFNAIVRTTSEK